MSEKKEKLQMINLPRTNDYKKDQEKDQEKPK